MAKYLFYIKGMSGMQDFHRNHTEICQEPFQFHRKHIENRKNFLMFQNRAVKGLYLVLS